MATVGPWRTSNDLILAVLAELGVLAPGQAVDPEDYAYVQTELDSVFRKLEGLEIVYVADPNSINSVFFRDLVAILAGECCVKFGANPDDFVRLKNAGLGGVQGVDVGFGAAAKSLRAIRRGRPTYEKLRVEYL